MQGAAPSRNSRKSKKAKSSAKNNVRRQSVQDGGATSSVQDGQKIFALIIGINEYGHKGRYDLKGAVADAEKVQAFICTKLKVPDTNISKLHNKDATRSAIIDGFRSLENNEKIVRNDATIIIYYAGHGAVADKPKDWTDWPVFENKIEMLCPADMSFPDSCASSDKPVEGIPDRTISRLLLDLSAAKGDNIILILDCCHSAGLNRSSNSALQPRRISSSLIKISPDCDSAIYSREIRKSRSAEAITKSGFSGSLWYSHVLLAACGRRESAMEEYKEGVFTRALLNVLEENNLKELTYQSLMQYVVSMLKDVSQTPHWDGKHTLRRIFCSPEEAADTHRVVCDRHAPGHREHNRLRLMSGFFHGTTRNSEFKIYRTDLASDTKPLATALVDEVDEFVSYLTISSPNEHIVFASGGNDRPWYARLTKAANVELAVYCNDSTFLTRVRETCATKLMVTVKGASTLDEASLFLKVEEKTVSFERQRGERNLLFGLAEDFPWNIYRTISVDDIADIRQIINHYAHFTYHLTRRSVHLQITDLVSIEMRELGLEGGLRTPVGPNMLQQLPGGGVKPIQVDVVSDKKAKTKYGFSVRNISEIDNLYVYLLCFEASDLEIALYFSPPMAPRDNGPIDGPLGRDSPLYLGFPREDDMKPVIFNVPDESVDVCFFQFFVATEPVNIRSLLQSPIGKCMQARRAELYDDSPPTAGKWASMTIPVIQNAAKTRRKAGHTTHDTKPGVPLHNSWT
ncbi:hypothetical protein ARMSODRAFT_1007875 [Armillaria solidipes]|uniref:Peptidase C14 caspase domain-containing protein n=1 Tax=Armillaria solidipes TaxID=1076256 RepID=A0A2H3AWY6_9AGAR|nr:hypothetical protein ARMSODRAFT_1007875 [Armillaria solidipes]